MPETPIAIRYTSTKTTAKMSVFSLSNAAATVVVNGTTYNIAAWASVGTDGDSVTNGDSSATQPVALYRADIAIAGLGQNMKYPGTVTQGANTINITVCTDFGDNDASVAVVTCYRCGFGTSKGIWGYIHAEYDAGRNIRALLHVDDHGYTDGYAVVAAGGNQRWNGVDPRSATVKTTYGYVVGYAAFMGLLANETQMHDTDMIWCHHNLPSYVWTGDHEITNNPERSGDVTTAWRDKALAAYKQTIGAVMPELNPAHAAAVNVVGPMELIGIDRAFTVMNNSAIYDISAQVNSGGISAGQRWLGVTQITDIKSALNTSSPFKVLMSGAQSYFVSDQAERLAIDAELVFADLAHSGSQDPIDGLTLDASGASEWNELVREPGGICDVANSYGAAFVAFHGDTHYPMERYAYKPPEGNKALLSMMQFSMGSCNGWHQHGLHRTKQAPSGYKGVQIRWQTKDITETQFIPGVANTGIIADLTQQHDGGWELSVDFVRSVGESAAGTVERTTKVYSGAVLQAPDGMRQGFL